jgi:hypothetical protein
MTTGLVVVDTRITTFFVVVSLRSVVVEMGVVASEIGLDATGLNGIRDVGAGDVELGKESGIKTPVFSFAS